MIFLFVEIFDDFLEDLVKLWTFLGLMYEILYK